MTSSTSPVPRPLIGTGVPVDISPQSRLQIAGHGPKDPVYIMFAGVHVCCSNKLGLHPAGMFML